MYPSRSEDQYPTARDNANEWPPETPTQPRRPLMPPSSPLYTPHAPAPQRVYGAGRHPYDPPDPPPGWPAQPGYGAPDRRPQRPAPAIDISSFTIADWLI